MFDFINSNNCRVYADFRKLAKAGASFCVSGLTSVAKLILLEKIKTLTGKKILFITSGEQNSLKSVNDLEKIYGIHPQQIPYQSISFYEEINSNKYDYAAQLDVLFSSPDIVVAPVKVFLEKFPDKDFYLKNTIEIKKGDSIDTAKIADAFVRLGYKRSTMVSDIGEFSIRGDIIDIYAPDKYALRIELWGDEVVDLRYFDNQTQKSIEKIDSAKILPLYKFLLDDKIKLNNEEEGFFEGIEVYQSLFNDLNTSALDYFNDYIVIVDESQEIFSRFEYFEKNYSNQFNENSETSYCAKLKSLNHFSLDEFQKKLAGFQKIYFDNFIGSGNETILEFNSTLLGNFDADIEKISEFILFKKDYNIYISTDYQERVSELLAENGIFNVNFLPSISNFGTDFEDFKLLILTDREIFNKRNKEITATKRSYYKEKPEFIENINDIKEGEYVVHSVHGIGIYKGLTHQEIDGQIKDYLTIEYACKDKIYIPAEQINNLCRYRGSGNVKPQLSRMGGNDWTNTKNKVKKAVETIAYDLLRLYARRKMAKGIQFLPDNDWQLEMEDAFEYTETPDQMKAINDVKADMESENPTDRLICGDVGFGKTEVAMRAIFKAVTSGKQAAVIVPTTILTLQHYQTMLDRFKPFGVNVDFLSRFKSQKEQKDILKKLATGELDVVIGTHRLLQDNVVFKDLGLLVIDEEHRFGVKHKEKLKSLRENIDIISMSATPIPRTLYMSLSGIKDLSVINTPPKNRLPIKTFVGEWKESIVKNAIMHELDREGQVFYVYNRVETILDMKRKLQNIVPNARIAVAHGQMNEKELEEIILDFEAKNYDILLCTTIIENGMDIPNANTMIIHDAERFGLAQLYQMRGRVGRSERQAYCYCFCKNIQNLTKEALERLKAIKEFTTLGSGYRIAMRDVEIRGVGNILGTKQHGHMINVGFDTYCELLDEAVHELQGDKKEEQVQSIVDINVTAFIPDEWVGSKEQKMIEYKRLANVSNETELDYIISEWHDRFSKIPESVENLIKLIKLRLLASACKIKLIRETDSNIRIYMPYNRVEWNVIASKTDPKILKKLRYTAAPVSCKDGISVILLNNNGDDFIEIYNLLTDMFTVILNTLNEYKEN
ncbi:transcription-repair coupling factor [bacterium]|nr:transcription-repair coupling factor [bacterium]